ncbi:MAG: M17 family metallopeptidase [Candidatus Absconditabacteria bacterium]
MITQIGKVKKTSHQIIISTNALFKDFDEQLSSFFINKMKIDKKSSFLVDMFVKVNGIKITNYIIIKLNKITDFETNIEEIVSKVGELIISTNGDVGLDFDKTSLCKEHRALFEDLIVYKLYNFNQFKSNNKSKYQLTIKDKYRDSLEYSSFVDNLFKTRDLICTCAEHINPDSLEKYVLHMFKENKNIKITVFSSKQLVSMSMGGIYGVGKGSDIPPRLIIIEYKPRPKEKFKYGLVGKGVTYDSGGYNLKPTGNIEDMYVDMGGASVVIGVTKYLVDNSYNDNIVIALPLAENLISGNAQKPGDVIKMYNGKTVEIGNTDAEGRLLLADSLAYIDKIYNPNVIVDIATLTGSQIVALGKSFAGLIGNNPKLNKSIQVLSLKIKERVWELPKFDPYFGSMKSDYADMKNISSGKFAPGCITAGLFLSQFVTKQNWIHLDVAGPMGGSSLGSDPLYGPYPTAFGYRLLINYLTKNR